jgi:hypothetical protein
MSDQANIAILRRYIEASYQGDVATISQLVSPLFSSRCPDIIPSSKSEFLQTVTEVDCVVETHSWQASYICQGDLVRVQQETVYSVTRPFGQLRPGYLYSGSGYSVWRVSGGQIVEYVEQGLLSGPIIMGRV